MPTRIARTAWNGTLQEGSGQVELSSSKVGTYEVSFPKRAADDAGGTTSPEELIAAAHSACFAMQLPADVAEDSGPPDEAEGAGRGRRPGRGRVREGRRGRQGRLPGEQGADRRRDHAGRRARLSTARPG